ncbi:MAG: hypothetical protein GY822_26000 [Deltaproteobacteria bacterium]|nr:hypothetical protein [Deltaproteobacteria bacterium]
MKLRTAPHDGSATSPTGSNRVRPTTTCGKRVSRQCTVVLLCAVALAATACSSCDPVNAPPPNAIEDVLAAGGPPDDKQVLVVVGDSITQGSIGARWATDVADSLGEDWVVVNAGTNGQVVWEVAERTDQVIALDPEVIVVLIGTNDVMAEYDPEFGAQAVAERALPQLSNQGFYREQLTRLTTELRDETNARVALLSIPTIGEDSDAAVWSLSEDYAFIVRDVAGEAAVEYGPLFENMAAALAEMPQRETPPIKDWLNLVGEGVFLHSFGQSWDAIGEGRGFYLHTDHLHLDEDGGDLVTDIVLDIVQE